MHPATTLVYSLYSLVAILILTKLVQVLRDTFFSSLKRVPGPWWSSITGVPRSLAIVGKRQVHFYHDLHQRYGPFVRIAPDEIIVSDVSAFKEIHRIGTPFVKSDMYKNLRPSEPGTGPMTLFSETTPSLHAKRRKLLARGFSQTYLRQDWEPIVQENVTRAVQSMKTECAKNGEVDILRWWMFMALDIISILMFGESSNALASGKKPAWLESLETTNAIGAIWWHFPLLYKAMRLMPLPAIKKALNSHKDIYAAGRTAVTNSQSSASSKNIFANILEQAEKDEGGMNDEEIIMEAGSFIVAGTDTTANTMTYLVWSVLSRPELQQILEKEVADLDEPLTDSGLEEPTVLNAVIKETLRLYGAAPGALPRVAPSPSGYQLERYYIPGGTTVSTQAWTMHRDPALFENPNTFDHTRWLSSEPTSQEAKTAFSPFGAGSRVCIGMHLAYMELRLATAIFFKECRGAKLAPSTTPKSMEIENTFLIAPKAGQCRIVVPSSER
ncbi:hypothetical protein LTR37_016065 [Vermiconidia calcicola]|uniref:Uncharacterized protein n=1 Tax=Vermiconidia calcicola TaxID=1690605 RepID=A0ACC3MNU9_9PEZI|nr:hypothetical protein LTR37_016065 [Vermiconidia calcicola]